MDASSPSAVRTPAPYPATHIDTVRKVRRVIEQQDQRRQHAREVSEAYELGRETAATEQWLKGAKVAFTCGLVLGVAIAGGVASVVSRLGMPTP